MNEEWRDIRGYEGYYQVSDEGRIRSLDRIVFEKTGKRKLLSGNLMNPNKTGRKVKYWRVTLSKNHVQKYKLVHRLVASAFIGEIPNGMEVSHIDNNGLNARLDNLEIVTKKENEEWKKACGRTAFGEKCGASKLKGHQVTFIKQLLGYGAKIVDVAKYYGMHPESISNIKWGRTWQKIR